MATVNEVGKKSWRLPRSPHVTTAEAAVLQPPPLETMMARSSTSTPSSTLRRLPPQGSSSACASAFPNSASDYGMLVANGTYALTAGNCVECSCGPANLDLYCTPYELDRAEMDIKMREERASMDRALKEEPDKNGFQTSFFNGTCS
ncbi:lysM domain-containing GPI-anchored protein 3-like [Miscanthus floridulus]|uniref:lysM domain-containing GPI-anchored protein 3-like n=1 Tax=Miscanthus floridulus TaxID=154761 RepID=UPI00345A8C97